MALSDFMFRDLSIRFLFLVFFPFCFVFARFFHICPFLPCFPHIVSPSLDLLALAILRQFVIVGIFPHVVGVLVEVVEQPEQSDDVEPVDPGEHLGDSCCLVHEVRAVEETQHELVHLHSRQVLLPPQIFLHVRSKSREHVVSVHHRVDETIQQGTEVRHSTRYIFDETPL